MSEEVSEGGSRKQDEVRGQHGRRDTQRDTDA